MEDGVTNALRSCVARNQALIDCLLARRTSDERRVDLYQRIVNAQDAARSAAEAEAATVQEQLLTTLEEVYALQHQQQRLMRSPRQAAPSCVGVASPSPGSAVQQLRTSLHDTQRFSEALRVELVRVASHCDELREAVTAKQQHCGDLADATTTLSMRRHGAAPPLSRSGASPAHTKEAVAADDEATCFAEALLMDTTQFFQRAFAAARDAVVEYIALQDELRVHLQRAPLQRIAGTSFEASMLNSVHLFANTYAQLRRCEQTRYEEVLRTVTHLLREPAP